MASSSPLSIEGKWTDGNAYTEVDPALYDGSTAFSCSMILNATSLKHSCPGGTRGESTGQVFDVDIRCEDKSQNGQEKSALKRHLRICQTQHEDKNAPNDGARYYSKLTIIQNSQKNASAVLGIEQIDELSGTVSAKKRIHLYYSEWRSEGGSNFNYVAHSFRPDHSK